MKFFFITLSIGCLFLAAGCNSFQTGYFGVEDKAIHSPGDFGKTQKLIEKAKRHGDSLYAEKQIDKAMELGKTAAITYWECYDQEAKNILALAREAALNSELYHPQPMPPDSKRSESIAGILDSPERIDAGEPFAGFKALPPRLTLNTIYFHFDETRIDPFYKEKLDQQVPVMKENDEKQFEIAGHTDAVGPDKYNYYLSKKRANSVVSYLASQGVSREQLTPVGYGENDPVVSNLTDAGRAENRRAENRLAASFLPPAKLKNLNALPPGTTIEIVHFNYGETQLLPVYHQLLDKTAAALKKNPSVSLAIIGYTDITGTEKANQALAEKRADTVKNYLIQNGVAETRLLTRSAGETDPIAPNDSSRGRGFNRRAELRITQKSQTEPRAQAPQPDQSPARYGVQVAALKQADNADFVKEKFTAKGYPVYRQKADVDGVTWYRVRLGPYANMEKARETLEQIKSSGLAKGGFVVKTP